MARRLAAGLTLIVLAAGCGGHRAPNVKGKPFPSALARLRANGYLVAVPSFPRSGGSLAGYRVAAQRTSATRTVTLKVEKAPPRIVAVIKVGTTPPPLPRLVGRTYRNASRTALQSGVWLRVTRVERLRPAASADGIDAFVVLSQRREASDTIAVRLGERPCWKTVINDWYSDGTLDGTYARRCYREALRQIPGDLPYSELPQLLRARLR
jgi:subtilisin family serine protease